MLRLSPERREWVCQITLYIALVLVAAAVSISVAYAAFRIGMPSPVAQWIGLEALILCAIVIMCLMEFQRSSMAFVLRSLFRLLLRRHARHPVQQAVASTSACSLIPRIPDVSALTPER